MLAVASQRRIWVFVVLFPELVTQHRDFVRDRTKGLKRSCFPTHRVGWHNGLLAIQLANIVNMLQKSVLADTKAQAYKSILDLGFSDDNVPLVDVARAKLWIKEERKQHERLILLVKECAKAADHEANIARIVEKDGFATVSAFEGSAEFDAEFKKHLEYVRKEAKKNHGFKTMAQTQAKQDKGMHYRSRYYESRLGHGQRNTKDVRHQPQLRPKGGPSPARPCNYCKSSEHWVQHCPLRGK